MKTDWKKEKKMREEKKLAQNSDWTNAKERKKTNQNDACSAGNSLFSRFVVFFSLTRSVSFYFLFCLIFIRQFLLIFSCSHVYFLDKKKFHQKL